MEASLTGALWPALRRTLLGPDVPAGSSPLARWPRLARHAGPAGLLALLGLFCAALAQEVDLALPFGVAVLFAALTVAPLALLPRRPLAAWRLTLLALAICTFNAPADAPWPWTPVLLLIAVAVLAVVAARVDRPVLIWVGLISAVPVLTMMNANNRIGALLLLGVLLVLGDLIRGNLASRRALAAQTERGDQERARRALLEERTRIARELHDVVAHHMSMIAVQAETAPYRLTDVPAPARAEFTAIAGSARAALTDMRRLLGVLRSESTGANTAPQPGLADVAALLAAAERAGMTVTRDGDPPEDVPAPVGLAAYRIVQEGLANAARHAAGAAARVTLRAEPGALTVRVENDPIAATPAGEGAGHGLTGMRERALALGGTFHAGSTGDGGYVVTARLPYDREDDA
ncbi:two-component sensor histidine kinase [Micromonospora sp. PLK6-60]|uniref:sensor histidine kinase n=1 Tax=Micromonospora sp. PLK6-60 TaxID=2873383 RepID=UPI001CA6C8A7|nr:histidine kinase [Micromonospora sp. PLK6-60]MBY8872533.1 two-component sensor histidine kinase [Micromonospora sp. PLK6-60]